jgi:hypothetical protein
MRHLISPIEREQSALAVRKLEFDQLDVVFALPLNDRKGLSTQYMGRMRNAYSRCFFVCIESVSCGIRGMTAPAFFMFSEAPNPLNRPK